jgi:hypothetical protein
MQNYTYFEKQVAAMATAELMERFSRNDGTMKSAQGHWEQTVVAMELRERGEFDD